MGRCLPGGPPRHYRPSWGCWGSCLPLGVAGPAGVGRRVGGGGLREWRPKVAASEGCASGCHGAAAFFPPCQTGVSPPPSSHLFSIHVARVVERSPFARQRRHHTWEWTGWTCNLPSQRLRSDGTAGRAPYFRPCLSPWGYSW